jgi:hypothetical protein
MDPPPQRGRSRYGGGGGSSWQQFPFVVDPTEAPGAAAVRAFFPAPGGEPPPPSGDRAAPGHQQQRYGRGEISLGHGQGMHHHRYHQFGVEGKRDAGPSAAAPLPRHSSSPPEFFSSPVVDNGKCVPLLYCCLLHTRNNYSKLDPNRALLFIGLDSHDS